MVVQVNKNINSIPNEGLFSFKSISYSALMYGMISIIFVLLVFGWAANFYKHWNSVQARLEVLFYGQVQSGGNNSERDVINPAFKGITKLHPVTSEPEVYYYDKLDWKCNRIFSVSVITMLMAIVLSSTVGILVYKQFMEENFNDFKWTAGVLNAIVINILNDVWQTVAKKMAEWENHRHLSSLEFSQTSKTFIFTFINSYIALFYIAFAKSADPCGCSPTYNCVYELQSALYSLIISRLTMQNLGELGITGNIVAYVMSFNPFKKPVKGSRQYSPVDSESCSVNGKIPWRLQEEKLKPVYGFDEHLGNYSEIVINHGYWILFAAMFPLGPLLTVALHRVELFVDTEGISNNFRRPLPMNTDKINLWKQVLEFVSRFAIISNSGLIIFTTLLFKNKSFTDKIFLFLLLVIFFSIAHALAEQKKPSQQKLAERMGKRFQLVVDRILGRANAVNSNGSKDNQGESGGRNEEKQNGDKEEKDSDIPKLTQNNRRTGTKIVKRAKKIKKNKKKKKNEQKKAAISSKGKAKKEKKAALKKEGEKRKANEVVRKEEKAKKKMEKKEKEQNRNATEKKQNRDTTRSKAAKKSKSNNDDEDEEIDLNSFKLPTTPSKRRRSLKTLRKSSSLMALKKGAKATISSPVEE